MKGKWKEILQLSGGEWQLTFVTRDNPVKAFYRIHDALLDIEVKRSSKGRSRDANAFMWGLCTDIGNAIRPPVPKEEVYRKAIRDVGKYFPVPVRNDLVEEWQKNWSRNGVGWFAEVTDKSKTPGYTLMFSYCGSSTYTTEEMSRLIDYLKDEMQQMGLTIPISQAEYERMIDLWGKA